MRGLKRPFHVAMRHLLNSLLVSAAMAGVACSPAGPSPDEEGTIIWEQVVREGDAPDGTPPPGAPLPLPPEVPDTTPPPPAGPPPAQGPALPGDPLANLAVCPNGVMAEISLDALQPPKAGSNGYRVPAAGRLVSLEASLVALLAGDGAQAQTYAATAEYLLCRGEGEESGLVLWRAPAGEGQARIVLRTGPSRPAIFEAPHPLHDSGTLEQARELFTTLSARALIVSGSHRCANSEASGCSGSTSTCGGASGPFRVSDAAHSEHSAFHTAHRALAEHFSDHWVVGVHGMGSAGASVSDGTDYPVTPAAPSAKLALALSERFSDVTTCNPIAGEGEGNTILPVADRLCGTTDVQGRHLNGVALACTEKAPSASGRFVHLEQSKAVRAANGQVAAALDEVLPPTGG